MNNAASSDEFFECHSSPYNEGVTQYVTRKVMDELFTTLQTNPYIITDYEQFKTTTDEIYREVYNATFPPGRPHQAHLYPLFTHTTHLKRACAAQSYNGIVVHRRPSPGLDVPIAFCTRCLFAQYTHSILLPICVSPPGGTPQSSNVEQNRYWK